MTTKDYLLDIITQFRQTLDAHKRQLECFDQYAIQVEGWLKGELVCLLNSEKLSGKLDDFQVEYPSGSGRKRVDFFLKLNGTPIWIELKHWQIGRQEKQRWIASDYFINKSFGICNDVEKLSNIPDGDKYVLILATKNPEYEEHGDWLNGVNKFNQKFTPLYIKSCTDPSKFSPSYFLGLLEVI